MQRLLQVGAGGAGIPVGEGLQKRDDGVDLSIVPDGRLALDDALRGIRDERLAPDRHAVQYVPRGRDCPLVARDAPSVAPAAQINSSSPLPRTAARTHRLGKPSATLLWRLS